MLALLGSLSVYFCPLKLGNNQARVPVAGRETLGTKERRDAASVARFTLALSFVWSSVSIRCSASSAGHCCPQPAAPTTLTRRLDLAGYHTTARSQTPAQPSAHRALALTFNPTDGSRAAWASAVGGISAARDLARLAKRLPREEIAGAPFSPEAEQFGCAESPRALKP